MGATAPEQTQTDLMYLLSWSSHALATELAMGLAHLGISQRAHCVLFQALAGNQTQSRIAEACGLDKTTMVVTTDKLEKDGLVRREPSPEDRRVRILVVTEKGRDLVARSRTIVDAVHTDVLSALPPHLREAFVESLTTLVSGRLSTFADCEQRPRRRSHPT
ncbi:MarR family transcriptional regulator [Frankia sp. Mgl5]|uniref:MarR family winged helix-turn-helix transcriptional regulator n=1 Tax=Frankia sp. Mgl5 TaxID=2933793 RepID=UPI00200DAFB0|nr:MarR family transcriptional regulator [Frankia sp. Mgl5]MCK9929744.1 MarR family transcriptional regulator [Frankia sp. Mgl5]